jgi:hypothetical protein
MWSSGMGTGIAPSLTDPAGRMGTPSELQGTIVSVQTSREVQNERVICPQVYMASDASSYLTGSDLVSLLNNEERKSLNLSYSDRGRRLHRLVVEISPSASPEVYQFWYLYLSIQTPMLWSSCARLLLHSENSYIHPSKTPCCISIPYSLAIFLMASSMSSSIPLPLPRNCLTLLK